MVTVFVPMHQQMMELVLEHADLIDESEMPLCLLDLCAHVSGYQAVLKQWESMTSRLPVKTTSRS